MQYILDTNKEPIKCDDIQEWGKFMQKNENKIISRHSVDGVDVSTVFLGIDHNHKDFGDPVLFETMIFGGEHDGEYWRYTDHDEALEGHRKALALIGG